MLCQIEPLVQHWVIFCLLLLLFILFLLLLLFIVVVLFANDRLYENVFTNVVDLYLWVYLFLCVLLCSFGVCAVLFVRLFIC